MIELVIKIPEGLKKEFELERWTSVSCIQMKNVLDKAIPLPKGHGRLIDESEVVSINECDGKVWCEAPTIIEADK